MTRKPLGKGYYGQHGKGVSLWLDGDRIVAQWLDGRAGSRSRKTRTWSNTAEHRVEAKVFAETLAAERVVGKVAPATLTTATMVARYREAELSVLRTRSQQLHRDAWRAWETFVGPATIAEALGPDTVAAFKADLERRQKRNGQIGWAVSTIGRTISQVKVVYAWAYRHRLITRNDVRDYRFKIGKEQRVAAPPEYTADEVAKLIEALPLVAGSWRAGALFRLANLGGLRLNEMRRLQWADLDLDGGTVTLRARWNKVGKETLQPLRPVAVEVLRAVQAFRTASPWVFPAATGDGEVYTAQAAIAALRTAERRAGVAYLKGRGYHGLRRKHFNDVLAAADGDVGTAMAALRDTDLRVVSRSYLKARNPRLATVYGKMDANGVVESNSNQTAKPAGE